MATEQVLQWINNDLSLSQSVVNFETDFSNGYLLGEILTQYGQTELLHFSKKRNKEAKVNNFYMIEISLRKLNVRFDGKLIHQIMEEERGASLRLLYQIKLACQKLNIERNDPDEASMTGLKNAKMHTILSNKRDATMEMTKTIPPPTVGGKDVRTSKQKFADKRTLGYDVAQKTLFDNAFTAHQAEMDLIKSITQDQRNSNMHKLMENQTFMKEWIQEGKQNWRLNQTKRAEAIEKVKYFEDREVNIYKQRLENQLLAATTEQINGFKDFEKNLEKLGIQQGISMEEAIKKQEEKKGIPPGQIQNFSYAAAMNKIKETKKNSDFAGKDRDRRRRKMIVDQQDAQTKLDREANEEALISKLLAQTSEEQRDAFIDERMNKCKHNDFMMRQGVAMTLEEKRKVQNEKAEQKRRANVKEVEAERARQNELKRQEAKKATFVKKMEKRVVNIEIASGLVDLLLDLADETFEIVNVHESHQIPNPVWRQFTGIFKSGKKCSLRNVVHTAAISEGPNNRDALSIPSDAQAHDIQKQFWQDSSMLNFYEYLSGSGAFNIPQLQPDMWQKYEEQYAALEQDKQANIPFVDIKLQQNGELVQIIDQLYKQSLHPSATEDLKVEGSSLLAQPTIKLALVGRAYSGKKTVAQALREVLGNDVAILNLDDIIKEAIDYISPKKQDESVVVDPKAKGKRGTKEETVHVDIFEGKNSAQYKSYAQQIKELYFSGENLPRKVDLAEFILDDNLLNGLVIEKLKLQTEGKAPMGQEQIKAGVARERELVKQLEDLEAAAALAAADPKSKAAKQAKGAATPETLKAELEEIRSFKASGWILIGYPQQLSQIKLLEHEMTGFSAQIDQPKSERAEIRETWRKLTLDSNDSTEVTVASQQPALSGFDSVIFLETPESECVRRAEGATDEAGNEQRIKTINENFDSKVGSLKKWCEQFGLIDHDGACKVTLNQEVSANEWDQKDAVKEAAIASIKRVMAFKQSQFDIQRSNYKDQLDQHIDIEDHLPTTPEKSHMSKKSQKHESRLNSPEKSLILAEDQSAAFTKEDNDKKMARTLDSKSNLDTMTNKSSRRNKQQNQQRFEIKDNQKITRWEEMLNDYYKNSVQRFNDLSKQRQRIFQLFQKTQSNFVSFICREAPYQQRVNEFCDNYNRFSDQYPELRGKDETKTELLKRVTILNDTLWSTILERKNQAVSEQVSLGLLMENGWETGEKSKLVSFIAQLMEYEFERFRTTTQVITGWVANQDIDMKGLCAKLEERAMSTFTLSEVGVAESPMLDTIITYLHVQIAQLVQEPFIKQLPENLLTVIYKERTNFHLRCNTLKQYALLLLIEINENTLEISAAFEDWIIQSVKKENAVASNVIKQVRLQVIADAGYLDNIKVQNADLEGAINRVQLEEGQPKYLFTGSQNTPRGLAETRMEIQTLQQMYEQFSQTAFEELLDSQTFLTIIIGNYQSYSVPQKWRNLPFQAMLVLVNKFAASPLTNDGESGRSPFDSIGVRVQFVNWKKIFVLMSLASTKLPSDESIQTYATNLAQFGTTISLADFKNADAWFDSSESATTASQMLRASSQFSTSDAGQDDEVYDKERLYKLKEMLWRTVKRTNEKGIRVQDLIQIITDLKQLYQSDEYTFGDLL